ncbi:11887_t:CDS:1, partial [Funneliformis geosporum]
MAILLLELNIIKKTLYMNITLENLSGSEFYDGINVNSIWRNT